MAPSCSGLVPGRASRGGRRWARVPAERGLSAACAGSSVRGHPRDVHAKAERRPRRPPAVCRCCAVRRVRTACGCSFRAWFLKEFRSQQKLVGSLVFMAADQWRRGHDRRRAPAPVHGATGAAIKRVSQRVCTRMCRFGHVSGKRAKVWEPSGDRTSGGPPRRTGGKKPTWG